MVAGFYISLDPPGDLSTGLCLVHAILPKREWLDRLGIDAYWPCQGIMEVIHTDNAKEFRGKTLARAAAEYGIELKRRPVRQPHYGGHVERMIGTTLKQLVHTMPGTTFSNITAKGEYDSEGNACLTVSECEKLFALWFTGSYHQTVHRTLLMTPLEKYRLGLLKSKAEGGQSSLRVPYDAARLRLDFLPSVERCVLPYGVVIDEIFYWSDILRPWINAKDPKHNNRKRLFLFKRDPRDVSAIYFLDPTNNTFQQVPYRNIAHPSISLWELRAVRRRLKEQGAKTIDEHIIFQTQDKMRAQFQSSSEKTLSARRESARSASRRKEEIAPGSPMQSDADRIIKDDPISDLYLQPIRAFKVREQ